MQHDVEQSLCQQPSVEFERLECIGSTVGKLEKEVSASGGESKLKHYVFTHVHYDIAYNGNRIVVSHSLHAWC